MIYRIKLILGLKKTLIPLFALVAVAIVCTLLSSSATASPSLIGLGDSIGEGVQSYNACARTQPNTYLAKVAAQMGVEFPLPSILTNAIGIVGEMENRRRLSPYEVCSNLAVSGADVASLLTEQADALNPQMMDTETDLVLFPRLGSQIEVAEIIAAPTAICWIGNNDVLEAATSFDQYDGSQMTPVDDFKADFTEISQRLTQASERVVFCNIPDVCNIGFLCNQDDLLFFLGNDYGLPEGHYTSIAAMLMIKLGLDDGSILNDPNYVLDAQEITTIQDRTNTFNDFIKQKANELGMPLVDINSLFKSVCETPYVFFDIPVKRRYLGGIFSLDGFHPSNIAHAIVANEVISVMNEHFGMSIPLISQEGLEDIFLEDPFIDKDADGVVTGRPFAGILETLAPLIGLSGDRDDWLPASKESLIDPEMGQVFIKQYIRLKEMHPARLRHWTTQDTVSAFKTLFPGI